MKQIIKWLWKYAKEYKILLLTVAAGCLLELAGTFFQPLIIRAITDQGMLAYDYHVIVKMSVILLLLLAALQGVYVFRNSLLLKVKMKILHKIYVDAFGKLLRLKMSYFSERNSGDIINQLYRDIDCVGILLNQGFVGMLAYSLRMAAGLVGLFYINWKMSVCILACVPLKYVLLRIISKKKEQTTRQSIETDKGVHAWLTDRIMGMREIKLLNQYQKEVEKFSEKKEKSLQYEKKSDILNLVDGSSETLVQGIMTGIFYFLGGYFVCNGAMSVGNVLAFISYSGNVTGPITMLMSMKLLIAQIRPSFERLRDFFLMEEEPSGSRKMGMSPEVLTVKSISFSYGEQPLLQDVSFTVKRGEKAAIIGENGSGKSTLLNILLKLYLPEKGEIFLDKEDAAEMDLGEYRSLFTVVSQFPYLFQETVRENLSYSGCFSDEELLEMFECLHMRELLKKLPEGLDTVIGVDGTTLSGGERQKLALLRAALSPAPVLILDECTSNFDRESEEWLFTCGMDLFADKIVLAVTHQIQYLSYMDKVYRLENGMLKREEKRV